MDGVRPKIVHSKFSNDDTSRFTFLPPSYAVSIFRGKEKKNDARFFLQKIASGVTRASHFRGARVVNISPFPIGQLC